MRLLREPTVAVVFWAYDPVPDVDMVGDVGKQGESGIDEQ
jgi:hypothetical protein